MRIKANIKTKQTEKEDDKRIRDIKDKILSGWYKPTIKDTKFLIDTVLQRTYERDFFESKYKEVKP